MTGSDILESDWYNGPPEAVSRFRNLTAVETDRWGVLLAALFMAVLAGAVWVATSLASLGVESAMGGSSGGEQAAAGAGWALAEVAVAVFLLGVIMLYNRLPEWAQDTIKTSLLIAVSMWAGVVAKEAGVLVSGATVLIGYYAITQVADAYDVYWLWNNVEAVVLAIVLGGMIGVILPLPFLIVGLIGLTIYDHVFANEKDWMFTLGGGMLRAKLPVVVFAFPRWRVAWSDIVAAVEPNEEPDDSSVVEDFKSDAGFGIGMADLLFPAAIAAAVTVAGGGVTLPVYGIVAGVIVAAFRLRWEMINVGGGAGLPAITAGTLGGYAAALIPVVVFA